MPDITTVWSPELGRGDWNLLGADLQSGSDLQTAVYISIFTDRVANSDDTIPDESANPRGWWGDDPQYPIGSRLWLLDRAKQDQATLTRAVDYIVEAVQWLIDDGVVARFDIFCEWTRASLLGVQLTAYKKDGNIEAMNFAWTWKGVQ
jgi:phage gp46-like protein